MNTNTNRSRLIVSITNLKVEIDQLEVMLNKYQDEENIAATRESLHERRQELYREQDRLAVIDKDWILKKEQYVEMLKRKAEQSDPGQRALIQDEIQDYESQIEKRWESLKAHGS